MRKQVAQEEFEIERLKLVHENETKNLKSNLTHQMKLLKDDAKTERLRMQIEVQKLDDEVSHFSLNLIISTVINLIADSVVAI